MKAEKSRHFLKILHTEEKDLGTYMCVAANRMGRAEKIISLTGNLIFKSLLNFEFYIEWLELIGIILQVLLRKL